MTAMVVVAMATAEHEGTAEVVAEWEVTGTDVTETGTSAASLPVDPPWKLRGNVQ